MSQGPPPVPGRRTPEEREAARREREARRAGRHSADGDGRAPAPPRRDWLAEARRLIARDGGEEKESAPAIRERPVRETAPPPAPLERTVAEPARSPAHRRGRVRAGRFAVALTLLLLAGVAAWFLWSLFQPFKGEGGTEVRIMVPRGASLDQIAELLERRGVVSSSFYFQTRARLAGRSGDLKPGSYRLREDMSYSAALDALAKGTPPNIVVLTIQEGRSRREVARMVDGQLEGSYLEATQRSRALNPREYRAENARNLEGFLFPATYELKRGRPMSALVEQQLSVFRQRFEQVNLGYARSKKLTPYDVLIIASLVEREAVLAKERPLIASVIYNRLREGMPLGIDATVRYLTDNWTEPLRQSELANPSPYNTRVNPGLPPGPIGSPGIDSIRAAARPARTRYRFFVVKPGGDGAHAFARTDAEHQRNVERYNSARDRLGGRSPD